MCKCTVCTRCLPSHVVARAAAHATYAISHWRRLARRALAIARRPAAAKRLVTCATRSMRDLLSAGHRATALAGWTRNRVFRGCALCFTRLTRAPPTGKSARAPNVAPRLVSRATRRTQAMRAACASAPTQQRPLPFNTPVPSTISIKLTRVRCYRTATAVPTTRVRPIELSAPSVRARSTAPMHPVPLTHAAAPHMHACCAHFSGPLHSVHEQTASRCHRSAPVLMRPPARSVREAAGCCENPSNICYERGYAGPALNCDLPLAARGTHQLASRGAPSLARPHFALCLPAGECRDFWPESTGATCNVRAHETDCAPAHGDCSQSTCCSVQEGLTSCPSFLARLARGPSSIPPADLRSVLRGHPCPQVPTPTTHASRKTRGRTRRGACAAAAPKVQA